MCKREATQVQIVQLLTDKLGLDVPSVETDLIETGVLDSLKLVELLLELELLFKAAIRLNDLEIESFRSVASIADLMLSGQAQVSIHPPAKPEEAADQLALGHVEL